VGKYYTEIMGNDQTNFLYKFNQKWKEELLTHNMPYCDAAQITAGNRLRPIIVAWGYYANTSDIKHERILDFAVSIELIHKASILLDDLIDGDEARHGLKTFHIEYSQSEAILYAIFLLNRSVTILYEKDSINNSLHTSVLLKTIRLMCKGGIKEISSKGICDVQDVIDIINSETTSLIENSFLLGYQLSNKSKDKIPQEILNIGHLCGYCFQILNDIEPFLAPDVNKEYKGAINPDFEKNRKNIVISYLYGACTKSERKRLASTSDFSFVCGLIQKYEIIDLILEDIEFKTNSIKNSISSLKKNNPSYYSDFAQFLDTTISICFQKCGLVFEHNFFSN